MFNPKLIENAKLIRSASFVSECVNGDVMTDFYDLGGSIVRVCYYRRSTQTTAEFIPVDSWEFNELQRMSNAA